MFCAYNIAEEENLQEPTGKIILFFPDGAAEFMGGGSVFFEDVGHLPGGTEAQNEIFRHDECGGTSVGGDLAAEAVLQDLLFQLGEFFERTPFAYAELIEREILFKFRFKFRVGGLQRNGCDRCVGHEKLFRRGLENARLVRGNPHEAFDLAVSDGGNGENVVGEKK